MTNITGNQLVKFLESLGCNTRESSELHTSMWSVYTGDFFIVPANNEIIDNKCLSHIIWQLGVTNKAFIDMWNEYNISNEQGR